MMAAARGAGGRDQEASVVSWPSGGAGVGHSFSAERWGLIKNIRCARSLRIRIILHKNSQIKYGRSAFIEYSASELCPD